MADSPFSVYRLLRQHILSAAKPAYLVTSEDFNLISASGELDFYGLNNIAKDEACDSYLHFLVGYDASEPLELRFYQFSEEVIAHVVLLPHEGNLIILFMDASAAYHQEVENQQKTNDLLILAERQDSLVKELVSARDTLANKQEELIEANKAKAKFIANMSDEIKSPLTSILGHASLLKNEFDESPDNLKMIEAVERSGRHLMSLVENLLDQMHIELDNVKLKLAPVDITDLLHDIETIFLPVAKRKKLEFKLRLKSLPPGNIKIDENRLRQVLVNLMNNAFKYTDLGKVVLTAEWIENNLNLEVYDTGKGIPESFREEIFTAFKNSEGKQGKGLGLSIAKQFIDLMDGKISCESVLGAETRFIISIPAEVIQKVNLSSTIIDEPEFGEEKNILIIERNEDLCQLYDIALTKVGFVVAHCSNVDEVPEYTARKHPELILISMEYQEESIEAVRRIRNSGFNDPILVLISTESSESNRQVFEAGANGYITKPINIIDLIETIKAYVSPVQTVDMDVTMRTYLRERFNEYLNLKKGYLVGIYNQLSTNSVDFENFNELEREVKQIMLTSEMYNYTAIMNAAKLTDNILKNRNSGTEVDSIIDLLESLKVFNSEIQLVLEN
ncbi:MAG: hybrid sensor histidine kinase/response regulator [Pseudomonadota bacterium]